MVVFMKHGDFVFVLWCRRGVGENHIVVKDDVRMVLSYDDDGDVGRREHF